MSKAPSAAAEALKISRLNLGPSQTEERKTLKRSYRGSSSTMARISLESLTLSCLCKKKLTGRLKLLQNILTII
jgi:hypothetical protein